MTKHAILSLFFFLAIPQAQATSQLGGCLNNLRQIDAAKEQCAIATNLPEGAALEHEWITPYLKGDAIPQCPAGGTYTIGTLGVFPKCSVETHAFDEMTRRGRIKKRKQLIASTACIIVPGLLMVPALILRIKRGRFKLWNIAVLLVCWPCASVALDFLVVLVFPSVYAR